MFFDHSIEIGLCFFGQLGRLASGRNLVRGFQDPGVVARIGEFQLGFRQGQHRVIGFRTQLDGQYASHGQIVTGFPA